MFHKAISVAGALLIGGAVILLMPEVSQARGGGGHGIGGHFGASPLGGGWHGGYGGGWHGGRLGGTYGHGYGYRRYGGFGYPYYGLYGGYYPGYYPYYDSSPYYPNYYSGYGPAADVAPDYGYTTPAPATDNQSLYSSSTAAVQPDSTAHVTVTVPADAKLTLNGTPTSSTGTVRQFVSPPLAPGNYGYDVEARWNDSGKEITQTQHVAVTPGAHVNVNFPMHPQTEKK